MTGFRAPIRAAVATSALSVWLVAAPVVPAEATSFSGLARDGLGNLLEGVRVLILTEQVGSSPVGETRTTSAGQFRIADLAPGAYRVAAVKDGYLSFLGTVDTSVRPTLDITLQAMPQDGSRPADAAWALRLPRRSILRRIEPPAPGGETGAREPDAPVAVASPPSFDRSVRGRVEQWFAVASTGLGESDDPGPNGSATRLSLDVPIHPGARMAVQAYRDRFAPDTAHDDEVLRRQDAGARFSLSYDTGLDSRLAVDAYYDQDRLDLPDGDPDAASWSRRSQRTWGYDASWSRQIDDHSSVRLRMDYRDSALDLPGGLAESPSEPFRAHSDRRISSRVVGASTSFESATTAGHRLRVDARAQRTQLPATNLQTPYHGNTPAMIEDGGWRVGLAAEDAWAVSGPWTVVYGMAYHDNLNVPGASVVVPRLGAAWSGAGMNARMMLSYHTSAEDPGSLPASMNRSGDTRALGYDVSLEAPVALGVRVRAARRYEPARFGFDRVGSDPSMRPTYVTDGHASTLRNSLSAEREFGASRLYGEISRGVAEGRLARAPVFDVPVLTLADRELEFGTGQLGLRLGPSGTEVVAEYRRVEETRVPSARERVTSIHELVEVRIAQDLGAVRSHAMTWRVLLMARSASTRGGDARDDEQLDLLGRQFSAGVSVAF